MSPNTNILDFAVITVVNGSKAIQLFGGVSNNDARLTNARLALPHTHSVRDIIDFDTALKEDKANKDMLGGYAGLDGNGLVLGREVPYGTALLTACQGNDARLSDSRLPTGAAGGDLSGSYPLPSVTGLLGQALPANLAGGYLKRTLLNDNWEENADVAADTVLADLQRRFAGLLYWLMQQGIELPEELLDETIEPYEPA